MFGGILDVEFDESGNIFVVDDVADEVRIFDSGGRFLERLGGTGDGPLQFRGVGEIKILANGRLLVSQNQGAHSLKVFRRDDSGGFSLSETFAFPGDLQGIGCVTEGRIFVSGHMSEDNTIFHEFALGTGSGGVKRSYGEGYQSGSWLVRDQLSEGPITCLKEPLRIIWAFLFFPEVRAYRVDADMLLWKGRVGDFMQDLIRSLRDGSAVRYNYTTNADQIVNLVGIDGDSGGHDQVLVQVDRWFARDSAMIRTYLVDAATGLGALLSDTLPLIKAWHPDRYVGVWREPFPRLEVRILGSDNEVELPR